MAKFEDIFSNEKLKEVPKEKFKILVDYREKNSLVPSILHRLGFDVEFKELKVADYILNEIAIERKTVDDFVSSIVDGRLESQMEELKQYEKKLIFIEGIEEKPLYHKNSRINENAIRGMLLSISLKHSISIIYTKNPEDSAIFLKVLANKKDKMKAINPSKKILDKKERAKFILEGFEGIGPKKAELLINEFKSLRNIFLLSDDILQERLGKNFKGFKILDEKFKD
jgi:Fanconi anemia group M protein